MEVTHSLGAGTGRMACIGIVWMKPGTQQAKNATRTQQAKNATSKERNKRRTQQERNAETIHDLSQTLPSPSMLASGAYGEVVLCTVYA